MKQKVTLAGIEVSRIGLGTNRLRHTRENVPFIKAAVAAGLQHVDTAHLYAGGESEQTIGEALSPFAPNVVVATKGGVGRGSPEVLRAEIEESLRRLRADTIALYYLHRVDPATPLEESLGAIKEYRDKGAIAHVGVSNVSVDQVERARKVVPISAVQNLYNIAERRYEAVVDYCTSEDIVFVPFYPLRAEPPPVAQDIARRHRTTVQQVMLAWLLHRSPMMLPIPGTLSLEHLEENLAALQMQLTDAEVEALN